MEAQIRELVKDPLVDNLDDYIEKEFELQFDTDSIESKLLADWEYYILIRKILGQSDNGDIQI